MVRPPSRCARMYRRSTRRRWRLYFGRHIRPPVLPARGVQPRPRRTCLLRRVSRQAAETGPIHHLPTTHLMRPVTRVAATAAALAIVVLATRQAPSEAAPTPLRTPPLSILPANIGVGIPTHEGLSLDFASPMDAASVAGSLQISPAATVHLAWSEDARHLHLT